MTGHGSAVGLGLAPRKRFCAERGRLDDGVVR